MVYDEKLRKEMQAWYASPRQAVVTDLANQLLLHRFWGHRQDRYEDVGNLTSLNAAQRSDFDKIVTALNAFLDTLPDGSKTATELLEREL